MGARIGTGGVVENGVLLVGADEDAGRSITGLGHDREALAGIQIPESRCAVVGAGDEPTLVGEHLHPHIVFVHEQLFFDEIGQAPHPDRTESIAGDESFHALKDELPHPLAPALSHKRPIRRGPDLHSACPITGGQQRVVVTEDQGCDPIHMACQGRDLGEGLHVPHDDGFVSA